MKKAVRQYTTHSPSSISSFISYRNSWYMSRFLGYSSFGNEATARGKAVEEGVNKIIELLHPDDYSCFSLTDPKFQDIFSAGVQCCNKTWEKEIAHLGIALPDPLYMKFSVKAITDSINYLMSLEPVEIHKQVPIKTTLDGCQMPVKGYIDYVVVNSEGVATIVDKKTSGTKKSAIPQGYLIQGAIYHKAISESRDCGGCVFDFSFFNKKECTDLQLKMSQKDVAYGLNLATKAAMAVEKIIIASTLLDDDTMKAMFFPDIESMFNQEEIADAKIVYEI